MSPLKEMCSSLQVLFCSFTNSTSTDFSLKIRVRVRVRVGNVPTVDLF